MFGSSRVSFARLVGQISLFAVTAISPRRAMRASIVVSRQTLDSMVSRFPKHHHLDHSGYWERGASRCG
jgi:hypothetical protein